jgi:hypothetical protein
MSIISEMLTACFGTLDIYASLIFNIVDEIAG